MDPTIKELQSTEAPANMKPHAASDPVGASQIGRTYAVPRLEYTVEEIRFRSELIYQLTLARDQRDSPHPELDMMSYIDYYESNKRKDLSYIPPKRNKQDTRIVTGITREKDTSLVNAILNMNLRPETTAFDENDLVVNELGDNISDVVMKTRELENWAEKRSTIYRELFSQGDVFVQEIYKEDFRMMPVGSINFDPSSREKKIADFTYTERLQKIYEGPESRMVNGKKVYLFNIREQYAHKQPGAAVLNILTRDQAKARYGTWERWANVPYTVDTTEFYFSDGTTYKDWNLVTLGNRDLVAEIMVYWAEKNRYMILLNGVMMLPITYPLTAICPTGEVPLAQGKFEPIADFAYSKSVPSKLKIDQEVADEVKMLMVEKMRQGFKPPMGVRGKKIYSSSIFLAGKLTNEINEGDLFPLLGDKFSGGVSPADFSFYKLVQDDMDRKSTSENFQGQSGEDGQQTAYETEVLRQQQMMSLGLALDGVVNLERKMTWNRIYTILTKWTSPCDTSFDALKQGIYDGYKSFSMNATVDGGRSGVKIFRQTTKGFPDVRKHEQEEEMLSRKAGKPVRIVYLNPETLRSVRYRWFIIINPSPKSNDKLSQLLFMQNLTTAIETFGPQSINMDYAKQRFSVLINEDYNKFFVKASIQTMLQSGTLPANQNGGGQPQPPANNGATPQVMPGQNRNGGAGVKRLQAAGSM